MILCQITKIIKVVKSITAGNPLLRQVAVTWDLFRKGTEMRERQLALHRKKDRSDSTLFIPFSLVHDYLFDDLTSLKYICKGFQVFCYILGVKVTDLVTLRFSSVCVLL